MEFDWSGPALTAEQMRACEAKAVAAGETTFDALMARAGEALVKAVVARWPEVVEGRAVVLCGPGNNGGDGFVVARLLQERGCAVTVLMLERTKRLSGAAGQACARWVEVGNVLDLDEDALGDALAKDPGLVVDALFGSGLNRPLTLPRGCLALLRDWRERGGRQVAVDCPSGLCSDTGTPLGDVLPADLTVTFHRPFVGQLTGRGPEICGRLHCVPIGLRQDDTGVPVLLGLGDTIPAGELDKRADAHKYDHGHALVLSGGVRRGGAGRLAARGALRIGAGAVTLGCPPAAMIENAAQLNAVMLQRIGDADDLSKTLSDARINVLCLGPGLGTGPREIDVLQRALGCRDRRLVLDADALTMLAQERSLWGMVHEGCVLTPHPGEFARLFPDLADRCGSEGVRRLSKVDATRRAAERAGCTVLLKGPDTVIASPDGRCALHAAVYDRAVPWLATAGSGDVLAGFVTGLLARGFDPFEAASVGAVLQAEAGRAIGPGLIAEDLSEVVPIVLRAALK